MYRNNTGSQFISVQLLLTASGAVATGLTPTCRRCIDGTFAAGGGTYTEDGTTGTYKYAMTQADTNGNDISFTHSATGAMPVCQNIVTTAVDPTNAATFGITNIDAAISSRMATYTQPTGFLAATFPSGTVANQTNITAGTIATVTTVTNQLTAAAIATGVWQDSTAGDFTTASSVGKSLYNAFTANSSVYTLASLANAPTGGSAPTAATIATAVWQDTTAGDFTTALSVGKSVMNGVALGTGLTIAAVSGAVGSVTGAVASVTARVSVTSNVQKNASGRNSFTMTDSTTHNPKTGLTVTATVSIDGAAFVAATNAVTEVANGDYTIVTAAADTNGNNLVWRYTATGADDVQIEIVTQP